MQYVFEILTSPVLEWYMCVRLVLEWPGFQMVSHLNIQKPDQECFVFEWWAMSHDLTN